MPNRTPADDEKSISISSNEEISDHEDDPFMISLENQSEGEEDDDMDLYDFD